uniref:RING-type domain-containing protein n=1 Tax=Lates calcarifer TaxID=8187 RepID=A0A4W6FFR8_LATCA
MELLLLGLDLLHHIHMLIFSNIWLSMASLVIFMQLRFLIQEVQKRIRRHHNYLRVLRNMETRSVSQEVRQSEIQKHLYISPDPPNPATCNYKPAAAASRNNNQTDAVFSPLSLSGFLWRLQTNWPPITTTVRSAGDVMSSARKLPCGHLFHSSCLRSWLEQDTSCPTCRMSLNIGEGGEGGQGEREARRPCRQHAAGAGVDARPHLNQLNHFFHFDGDAVKTMYLAKPYLLPSL